MKLEHIVKEIKEYRGLTRKRIISDIVSFFPLFHNSKIIASFGEDAAVIEHEDEVILLAADGIIEDLIEINPFWAGYCSVLVNINDIAGMGGQPIAMVDVISIKNEKFFTEVIHGINSAILKFNVPMVGGHTHPDCGYNAIDVAILGLAKKDEVIYSDTAKIDDDIMFAVDLDGKFVSSLPHCWDTTSFKPSKEVREQIMVMNKLSKQKLLTAGKDISNPGCLGTLGMLLESSQKGAVVDLKKIPIPKNVSFIQWLKVYPGCGFVITCKSKSSKKIIKIFNEVGLDAQIAGKITDTNKLKIHDEKETKILFDFNKEMITGCGKRAK